MPTIHPSYECEYELSNNSSVVSFFPTQDDTSHQRIGRKSLISLGKVAPQLALLSSCEIPIPSLEKQFTFSESELDFTNNLRAAQVSVVAFGNGKNSVQEHLPRSTKMFHAKIIPALKEKGIRRMISRKDRPHELQHAMPGGKIQLFEDFLCCKRIKTNYRDKDCLKN
ncbi:hypothetical protein Tco_0275843 [Tanacetum coccineum]